MTSKMILAICGIPVILVIIIILVMRKSPKTRIKNGYEQILGNDGIWRNKHTLVAEQKVGGKIGKDRVVHHIDGNKRNNNPANLWVLPRWYHSLMHLKMRQDR